MGLISRKENRVRQRREAAQHTAPTRAANRKKGTLSKGKDTDVFEGQAKARERREENGGGTQKVLLVFVERKCWQGLSKNWQVLSCTR